MDMAWLMLTLLFSLIGTAMFMYGKKQQRIACLASGLALMIAPYFIASHLVMLIVGSALTATPAVWKA